MKYKILKADLIESLEIGVNSYLDKGWKLKDHLLLRERGNMTDYIQVMVKEE